MTSPTFGYPDFQQYAIWRGPDFLVNSATHVDSTHPLHTEGQISHYASLYVRAKPVGFPNTTVAVIFYTDSTKTVQVQGFTWTLSTLTTLAVLLPALGNFVTVDVTTTDAVGGNVGFAAFPTNTNVSAPRYLSNANYVEALSSSIGAGITFLFPLPFVGGGKGHFFFNDEQLSAKLTFRVVVVDGTPARLFDLAAQIDIAGIFQGEIQLPDQSVAVFVHNDDVAAHNVTYSLHCDTR